MLLKIFVHERITPVDMPHQGLNRDSDVRTCDVSIRHRRSTTFLKGLYSLHA